ncbi:MAG TPA: HAD-IIA family hydrolase [Nocardioides sp.]|nr:HAD-IIA family hydrolase [Nocardioides sp.]
MAEPRGESLATAYDLLMFDLDGVVYVDGHAVQHAAESIAGARSGGAHIAFITNNAARTPQQVADHLAELGIQADPADVVTSSQAAARLLANEHGAGAPIAVLGADGLSTALREAGLDPVEVGDPRAVAIVSGYAPEMRWRVIMRAATLIRNGLPWVVTNTDETLPTDDGLAPGHGLLVRLISDFAQIKPQVAGKPQRPLLDETRLRVEGEHPLMVGDRLDTDISGAHEAGVDSLLVMTGVSSLADLVAARPDQRPTWIGHDLTALGRAGWTAEESDGGWRAGPWAARLEEGRLLVEGSGSGEGDLDPWWTAVAAAAWAHLDAAGSPADTSGLTVPARAAPAG